ncbi:hypothetical protein BJV77DRAFT_959234 [Russula vinacea]|nr:hypothetical protein BJV77DRAFT_959234 [Russula vinacea]
MAFTLVAKALRKRGYFIRESESLARVEEERYKQTTPATVDITTSLRQATGAQGGEVHRYKPISMQTSQGHSFPPQIKASQPASLNPTTTTTTAKRMPSSSSPNVAVSSFSLFPTATAAPCAFGLFGQDPRETHATYQDLASIIMARPSAHGHGHKTSSLPEATRKTGTSGANSLIASLRRFFGSS